MSKLLALITFLLPIIAFGSDLDEPTGTIIGRVITRDNQPAAFVSIVIIGSNRSAITDEEGNFVITKVPAGKQKLEVTLVGYETLVKEILVKENEVSKTDL